MMKKISIISLAALSLGIGFTSCESPKKAKNVEITNEADSLSYAIGVQRADDMLTTYPSRKGLDIAHMDQFVQGFLDEMYSTKVVDRNYELGVETAKDLKKGLNAPLLPTDPDTRPTKDAFVDGVVETMLESPDAKMTANEARMYVEKIIEKIEREMNAAAIKAEEDFLAGNKTKEGIVETPSGLQYKIITEGNGEIPGENMMVKVHFTGTFTDGSPFGSSIERGEPIEFNTSGGMIEAWKEAVKMMPVGSKWIIYSPSKLAFGREGDEGVAPYTPLIFEIELLDVTKETGN